jgi:putative photosynthetic complex assembly protein 2
MSLVAHAVLFTVFVWWFTTGVIIYLDGLPQRTFKVSMLFATALAVASLHGLAATSDDTSVTGAYLAFGFALMTWGWNEMGFLMGVITGPRTTACPEGLTGTARLNAAIQSVLYHEVAIAATGFAIMVVTSGGANQVGLWTFATLWVMRLSAKVNVYLGVPNVTEDFLPPHLKYLKSYFRIRPMNALFPISITAATVLTVYLASLARAPSATAFDVTAYTLLATLSGLALLEHWFMVLPIPSEALWKWGLTSHVANAAPTGGPTERPPADATILTQQATIVPFPALTPATHRRRT